ncbi:MAG: hypothetical protein VB104_07840 [Candidatus Limiplasma sp.]|nr:hypothetical protein [Candidatus Limiplasma sp.]
MTIWNQYEEPGLILALWIILTIVGASATIAVFTGGDVVGWIAKLLSLLLIVAGVMGILFWTPYRTRVEATFARPVDMTAIAAEYRVIEQRGEIWVLEERGNGE